MKQIKKHFTLSTFLGTCFFIGYTPFAPGTAASLIAMLTLYFLPPISIFPYFIILNILFFAGTVAAEKLVIQTEERDPSLVVIDEWFGMWLALFLVPKSFWLYVLAFVIFRIFDILKPKPISTIEKNIAGGLGVMLDDACAGFFTLIIIHGIATILL